MIGGKKTDFNINFICFCSFKYKISDFVNKGLWNIFPLAVSNYSISDPTYKHEQVGTVIFVELYLFMPTTGSNYSHFLCRYNLFSADF